MGGKKYHLHAFCVILGFFEPGRQRLENISEYMNAFFVKPLVLLVDIQPMPRLV